MIFDDVLIITSMFRRCAKWKFDGYIHVAKKTTNGASSVANTNQKSPAVAVEPSRKDVVEITYTTGRHGTVNNEADLAELRKTYPTLGMRSSFGNLRANHGIRTIIPNASKTIDAFYNGEMSVDEVRKNLSEGIAEAFEYYKAIGGPPVADNIEGVADILLKEFRRDVLHSAAYANQEEGIAKGLLSYYNSDFEHASRELIATIEELVQDAGEKIGVDVDLNSYKNNLGDDPKFRLGSFTERWNYRNRFENDGIMQIPNNGADVPKGFTFGVQFIEGSLNDAIMHLGISGESLQIPFGVTPNYKSLFDYFNEEDDDRYSREIIGFLKNTKVFDHPASMIKSDEQKAKDLGISLDDYYRNQDFYGI